MKKLTLIFVLLALSFGIQAFGPDVISAPERVLTNQLISPSSSVNSSVYSKLGNTKAQSVLVTVTTTGGIPAISVECWESFDGTNFYAPTLGASVTSMAVATSAIAPLYAPAAPYMRFKVLNTSGSSPATCNLYVLSQ